MAEDRAGRLRWAALFVTALLVYGIYLWPIPAPMTIRQIYLSRSLTEGHIWVDPYSPPVGDVGVANSHVYTTVPLPAALGMPVVAGVRASGLVSNAPGPWATRDEVKLLVPFTLLVATIPAAFAVVAFALVLGAFGLGSREVLVGAFLYAAATPIIAYASVAHAVGLSQLSVLLAILGLIRGPEDRRWFALTGFALGTAVLSEYHAAWVVPALCLTVLATGGLRGSLWAAAGGAPSFGALFLYHLASTGSAARAPLEESPYRFPSPVVFFEVLLGPWKGLLVYWPIVAIALAGLVKIAWTTPARRRLAIGLLAAAFCEVLANACIPSNADLTWWSFEGYGPRYSLLMVPCVVLGIPAGLALVGRRAGALAAIASVFVSWTGAQASWQLLTHESLRELFALGPRLRGVVILGALAGWRDPERVAVLAALVALPLVALAGFTIWRRELGLDAKRIVALVAAVAVGQALLAVPYFALYRGSENAFRSAAARRGILAEATLPLKPARYVILADLLDGYGDREGCRSLYAKALDAAPKDPGVLAGVLRGLSRQGDRRDAAIVARRLLAVAPHDVELRVHYARELHVAGKDDEAREVWRQLLDARPDVGSRADVQRDVRALGLVH